MDRDSHLNQQGYFLSISAKVLGSESDRPERKLVLTFVENKSSAEKLREVVTGQTSLACCVELGNDIECSRISSVGQVEACYRKKIKDSLNIAMDLTFASHIILCLPGWQQQSLEKMLEGLAGAI